MTAIRGTMLMAGVIVVVAPTIFGQQGGGRGYGTPGCTQLRLRQRDMSCTTQTVTASTTQPADSAGNSAGIRQGGADIVARCGRYRGGHAWSVSNDQTQVRNRCGCRSGWHRCWRRPTGGLRLNSEDIPGDGW